MNPTWGQQCVTHLQDLAVIVSECSGLVSVRSDYAALKEARALWGKQTNKQTNIENTCILSTKHYIVNYLSVPWICCDQMLCNASGCKKIPLMTNSPLLLVAIESDVYFDGYAETGQLVCVGNNTKDSTYICFSFTPLLHRFSPLPYFSTGWNSQYLYCISCESHYLLIPHFPILFPNKPVMV